MDVVVLGSGVAGLTTAIHAVAAGLRVALVTKGELAHSATRYAQGGVAAALEAYDSPELHLEDTLAAGGGLCDRSAVRTMVTEGPARVRELVALGAEFDRSGEGPALAREGGHSVPRILHAGGDATGMEIERALVAAVRDGAAEVLESRFATDLLVEDHRVVGVRILDGEGDFAPLRARHTVLATGGAGQMYAVTTNPHLSTGDGIAMARRCGAAVADLEFVQFHPTALHHPSMPRPLLSEALRGEGAILRDEHGRSFMAEEHPMGDLAPRDVVSRAIASRLRERGLDHLWLDATPIAGFPSRFPSVWRACREVGLDPEHEWLPVAPAAHYLSGGVVADLDGATSLPGLWAVGEAACSGVHGANRLASNSLLDGLVFGARAAVAVAGGKDGPEPTGAMEGVPLDGGPVLREASPQRAAVDVEAARMRLQRTMTDDAGVLRDRASLARAGEALEGLADEASTAGGDPEGTELANLVDVASGLVRAALARTESRGTHTRLDFPGPDPALVGRLVAVGAAPPQLVPLADRSPA